MTNKVQSCCYYGGRESTDASHDEEREKLTSKNDFTASCISYAVGWGIFGIFRIFVTRTAEVTTLSVDIYQSPF